MPPRSANKKGSAKKCSARKKVEKAKAPRCKTCGKAIRVPEGWTAGPAVRRHYWAKHREAMQPTFGASK